MFPCPALLPWTTRHMPAPRAWRTARAPAPVRTAQMPVAPDLCLPPCPFPGQSSGWTPWLSSCGSHTWPSCSSLSWLYWELGVTGKELLTHVALAGLRCRLSFEGNQGFRSWHWMCFPAHPGKGPSYLSMDQYWTAKTHCLSTVITLFKVMLLCLYVSGFLDTTSHCITLMV